MKPFWALIFFSVCALVIVAFQAIKQDWNIRRTRTQITVYTDEVKSMEEKIVASKVKLRKLSKELGPLDKQKKQLMTLMDESVKMNENVEQALDICHLRKSDVEQQKSGLASEVDMLKTNNNGEVQQLQEEIQRLSQHIIGRDSVICEYVDNVKGRKMCEDIKVEARNVID